MGGHHQQQLVSGRSPGCNASLVEGEVDNNNRVHLGEEERSYECRRL